MQALLPSLAASARSMPDLYFLLCLCHASGTSSYEFMQREFSRMLTWKTLPLINLVCSASFALFPDDSKAKKSLLELSAVRGSLLLQAGRGSEWASADCFETVGGKIETLSFSLADEQRSKMQFGILRSLASNIAKIKKTKRVEVRKRGGGVGGATAVVKGVFSMFGSLMSKEEPKKTREEEQKRVLPKQGNFYYDE